MTALPHRQGCGPASRRTPPRGARAIGRGAPRERGRPARMLSRYVQLSFPAMGDPAGGYGWGSAEAESWCRCRSSRVEELGQTLPVLCGRDARAPGGLHSVTSSQQGRSIDVLHMNLSHVEGKSASPGAGDEGAAGRRVVREGAAIPAVPPERAGNQVGGGPQGEGQGRQRPGHQRKPDPLDHLARQVRR